jgi:hypothetical protein
MDSYRRRLTGYEVDTRQSELGVEGDPKITLTCLNAVNGTSEAESSVRLPAVRRGSLYDAIREMSAYEAAAQEERRRRDRDGLLRSQRSG